jgi:hypothetical protein
MVAPKVRSVDNATQRDTHRNINFHDRTLVDSAQAAEERAMGALVEKGDPTVKYIIYNVFTQDGRR